jgi:hypothetical protein
VHDIAFVFSALGQDTGFQCRHFYGDLVGIELDQRVARGDGVAFLLLPARNSGFND